LPELKRLYYKGLRIGRKMFRTVKFTVFEFKIAVVNIGCSKEFPTQLTNPTFLMHIFPLGGSVCPKVEVKLSLCLIN
jgi:hypothetical protein